VTRTPWALGLGVGLVVVGCELGQVVTLGHSVAAGGASGSGGAAGGGTGTGAGPALGGMGGLPPILTATSITLLSELSDPEKDDNPTLTSDELMICFTSLRPGGAGDNDVWCAERSSTSEPFGAPAPVDAVNDDGFDASSALSLDGLSLWFGSEREGSVGGTDIFVVNRSSRTEAWGAVVRVDELCSGEDDIPRPTAMAGTVMPLGSRRGDDVSYWTYFATRPSVTAPFGPPVLPAELAETDMNVVDGFLTEDGLMLLFTRDSRTDTAPEDVYVAVRPDLGSPFGTPVPVAGLNGSDNDRDPWLSLDRQRLYFSSNRSGEFEIYIAELE